MREKPKVQAVRTRADGDVGYIRVAQFNDQTGAEIKKAIADLATQIGADKLKGYVIDLRNDPGGPLDSATYTCGCGYLFSAAVSTSVECPHCGCGQAW